MLLRMQRSFFLMHLEVRQCQMNVAATLQLYHSTHQSRKLSIRNVQLNSGGE